ncbi:MAG: PIN domain-containing protein [Pirellulaceae bacterium]
MGSNPSPNRSYECRPNYARDTPPSGTPDAIHAATAILAGATLLVTNDYNLRQVTELSVAVLNDLLAP